MNKPLELLCAGAAQGLVKALQERFFADTGTRVNARFGAVGAIKELLLSGEPCDVMVATEAMIDALADEGRLQAATRQPLGRVRTGLAVRSGEPRPDVSTPEALTAALLAAETIFFPDPVRATAGIHFANVMRELGIHDELQPRFRNFPNGATSMRELAATSAPRQIGCTQITEINYTEGIALLGALPDRFELATVYTAATNTNAAQPELARRFIALLAGTDSLALRQAGGFEF
ncbi:MAG: substrate-binding domain-containing protein [Burkholderiaceae bacterium]